MTSVYWVNDHHTTKPTMTLQLELTYVFNIVQKNLTAMGTKCRDSFSNILFANCNYTKDCSTTMPKIHKIASQSI